MASSQTTKTIPIKPTDIPLLYAFLARPKTSGEWSYALTDWTTSWIVRAS